MLVQLDGRALLVVFVFLVCLAITSVKTFGVLSGVTPPTSAYVIAILFAGILYIIFSVAGLAIKAFLRK